MPSSRLPVSSDSDEAIREWARQMGKANMPKAFVYLGDAPRPGQQLMAVIHYNRPGQPVERICKPITELPPGKG